MLRDRPIERSARAPRPDPYRPKRRAQDAIAEIHHLGSPSRNYEWVFEADIKACFDEIDHAAHMGRVRHRIGDKRVLGWVKAFLRAGILCEDGLNRLEPEVEPLFHPDSYGYRPGRSAVDALGTCRKRCWKFDWVIDLDLRSFFDSIDHDLMLKAVSKHTDLRWVLLYVKRWLEAPLQREDGTLVARDRATPQGSAISPLLANLFLHYAFDRWMAKQFRWLPVRALRG